MCCMAVRPRPVICDILYTVYSLSAIYSLIRLLNSVDLTFFYLDVMLTPPCLIMLYFEYFVNV